MLQAPTFAAYLLHFDLLHLLQASVQPAGLASPPYHSAVGHKDSQTACCCSALALLLLQLLSWSGFDRVLSHSNGLCRCRGC